MSVSGSYRYSHNNCKYEGKYSFKVLLAAGMEHDYSQDYILYEGAKKISDLNWKEIVYNGEGNNKTTELQKRMEPDIRLNYVLKRKGKICFDFEVFLKGPNIGNSDPLKKLLLPRSALNKTINHHDDYNKNVIKGSNSICLPGKLILNQFETLKEFRWHWQRKNDAFWNSHLVDLKLKIIKKQETS